MGLKALVAASPRVLLPTKRKVSVVAVGYIPVVTLPLPQGKYYMLLEYASQMYRSLIPAPLWFRYLSNYYQTGRLFAIFITAIYLMIKVCHHGWPASQLVTPGVVISKGDPEWLVQQPMNDEGWSEVFVIHVSFVTNLDYMAIKLDHYKCTIPRPLASEIKFITCT